MGSIDWTNAAIEAAMVGAVGGVIAMMSDKVSYYRLGLLTASSFAAGAAGDLLYSNYKIEDMIIGKQLGKTALTLVSYPILDMAFDADSRAFGKQLIWVGSSDFIGRIASDPAKKLIAGLK